MPCVVSLVSLTHIPHPEPRNRIFALNFPYKHTSSEIRALFEEALGPSEPIVDVKVPASKKGRGTGYAFIEFTSEESARKALELDGKVQTGGVSWNFFLSFVYLSVCLSACLSP